jgi:hypothetical protein
LAIADTDAPPCSRPAHKSRYSNIPVIFGALLPSVLSDIGFMVVKPLDLDTVKRMVFDGSGQPYPN